LLEPKKNNGQKNADCLPKLAGKQSA